MQERKSAPRRGEWASNGPLAGPLRDDAEDVSPRVLARSPRPMAQVNVGWDANGSPVEGSDHA